MTIEEFDKLSRTVDQIRHLRSFIDAFEKGTSENRIMTIEKQMYLGNIYEKELCLSVNGRDKLKNAILDCLKEELQEKEQWFEKVNMGEE